MKHAAKKIKSKVLACGSNKGGVGKTTFVCHLAVYLTLIGFRVAVIDCDDGLGTSDFFAQRKEKSLPCPDLYRAPNAVDNLVRRIKSAYDFVLIDTPGFLNPLFRQSASVSDVVVTLANPSSILETSLACDVMAQFSPQVSTFGFKPYLLLSRVRHHQRNDAISFREHAQNESDYNFKVIAQNFWDLTPFVSAFNEGLGVHDVKKGTAKPRACIELIAKELELV